MSRYQLKPDHECRVVVDTKNQVLVARLFPSEANPTSTNFIEFCASLTKLLSAPAQFEVTQRLMTGEEFRQVQNLRDRRELIQREMQHVALERTLEVRVAGFPRPHLTEPATRGVLSQLMDDLAHNGNAIRKLAVFLEPGAAE